MTAALQAGQVDIGFTGTSSAISSQLTDVPYVRRSRVLAIDPDRRPHLPGRTSRPRTTVKAKKATIAISTFGGTSNAAALLSLKALA